VTNLVSEDVEIRLTAISIITAIHNDDHDAVTTILDDLEPDDILPVFIVAIVLLEGVAESLIATLSALDPEDDNVYSSYGELLQMLSQHVLEAENNQEE